MTSKKLNEKNLKKIPEAVITKSIENKEIKATDNSNNDKYDLTKTSLAVFSSKREKASNSKPKKISSNPREKIIYKSLNNESKKAKKSNPSQNKNRATQTSQTKKPEMLSKEIIISKSTQQTIKKKLKETIKIDCKDDFYKKELEFNSIIAKLENYSLYIHFFKTIFIKVLDVVNSYFLSTSIETSNNSTTSEITINPYYHIDIVKVEIFKKNARNLISTKLNVECDTLLNDIKFLSEECYKIPPRFYLLERKILFFIYDFYKIRICSCLENLKILRNSIKTNKIVPVDKNTTIYAITTKFLASESSTNRESQITSTNKTGDEDFLNSLDTLIKNIEYFISELESVSKTISTTEQKIFENQRYFYNHFYERFENFIKNNSDFLESRINGKLNDKIKSREIFNTNLSMNQMKELKAVQQKSKKSIKDDFKAVLKDSLFSNEHFSCFENLMLNIDNFLDCILKNKGLIEKLPA